MSMYMTLNKDDALLAFSRHATSKILTDDDLKFLDNDEISSIFVNGAKNIFIDVEIPAIPSFAGYYISRIYVEYFKNRKSNGEPSKKAAVFLENDTDSVITFSGTFNIGDMKKSDPMVTTFKDGLFYVIVECSPMHNDAANKVIDIKAVLDEHRMYSLGMVGVTTVVTESARFLSICRSLLFCGMQ